MKIHNALINEKVKNIPSNVDKKITLKKMLSKYNKDIKNIIKKLNYRESTSDLEFCQEEWKNRLDYDVQHIAYLYASRNKKVTYEYINDSFVINYCIIEDDNVYDVRKVYKDLNRFVKDVKIPSSKATLTNLFSGPYYELYVDGVKRERSKPGGFDALVFFEGKNRDDFSNPHGILFDAITYYVMTYELEEMKKRNQKRVENTKKCEKYLRLFPIKLKNNDFICFDSISNNESNRLKMNYLINNGLDKSDIVDFDNLSFILKEKIKSIPVDESYYPDFLNPSHYDDLIDIQDKFTTFDEEYNRFLIEEESLTNTELRKQLETGKIDNEVIEKRRLEELKRKHITELQNLVVNTLRSLNSLIDESNTPITKYPIQEELLFSYENGVKRIYDKFIPNLKYLDLSLISFDGVDISGIDFRDCNPSFINPQTVNNKNLSNTRFIDDLSRVNNTFPFGVNSDFNGVNLSGANIEINEHSFVKFDGALTDDTTSINYNYSSDNKEKTK